MSDGKAGADMAKPSSRDPKGPAQSVVKRLFARSGNRCAFPKCAIEIIQGNAVVGEICHIKAASPDGPRYDAQQTAAERHGYGNLILLCANHHTIIDDDPEAYTVDRLLKMKADHEQRVSRMSDAEVDAGARLLMDQSVTAVNQSGGITAHTVNAHTINVHADRQAPVSAADTRPDTFLAAEPRDGEARFRPAGKPIGVHWDAFRFAVTDEKEIVLSAGPAMWLRLMPTVDPARTWSAQELKQWATHGGVYLQPFFWPTLYYLRAEDGFGMYSMMGQNERETTSVAFAFETGEIWSIDTSLLSGCGDFLLPAEIEKMYVQQLHEYARVLQGLGIAPPYRWISGLTGVKNRRLQIPPPPNHMNFFPGPSCLADIITAEGTYDLQQTPMDALRPFFELIFRKCSVTRPDYLER